MLYRKVEQGLLEVIAREILENRLTAIITRKLNSFIEQTSIRVKNV
jgi:hypothetical protein